MSSSTADAGFTPNENLTFEKTWALFQETDRKFQETDRKFQETDRKFQETDRKFKELREERREEMKKLDLQMKETDRRIGELGNRFGELAEHMVAPNIMKKFNELGFTFTISSQNYKIVDPEDPKIITEVDIFLENGDIAIAVEVKAKPKQADVDDHIRRLEKLRCAADKRGGKLRYQGAIAGAIMSGSVRDYSLKMGFYVIEQTGDTVQINIPEGFTARDW